MGLILFPWWLASVSTGNRALCETIKILTTITTDSDKLQLDENKFCAMFITQSASLHTVSHSTWDSLWMKGIQEVFFSSSSLKDTSAMHWFLFATSSLANPKGVHLFPDLLGRTKLVAAVSTKHCLAKTHSETTQILAFKKFEGNRKRHKQNCEQQQWLRLKTNNKKRKNSLCLEVFWSVTKFN